LVLYSYKGVGIAASGSSSTSQNWNTAFGALYATNINWEAYSFGRLDATLDLAKSQVARDSLDVLQEKFAHSMKIGAAYFNVLAAQKFVEVSQANLKRVTALQDVVKARAKNGLNAGVDSSIANAEVSNARQGLLMPKTLKFRQMHSWHNFSTRLLKPLIWTVYILSVFLKAWKLLSLSSKIQPFNGMLQELL
jgi:outer membrane protein TolC